MCKLTRALELNSTMAFVYYSLYVSIASSGFSMLSLPLGFTTYLLLSLPFQEMHRRRNDVTIELRKVGGSVIY